MSTSHKVDRPRVIETADKAQVVCIGVWILLRIESDNSIRFIEWDIAPADMREACRPLIKSLGLESEVFDR